MVDRSLCGVQWEQLSLETPQYVTVLLRAGIWTASGDVQYQVESHDASAGHLLSMYAWPALSRHRAVVGNAEAVNMWSSLVADLRGPFPR